MTFHSEEFMLCGRWKCVNYEASVDFSDYDKIFAYLRWKVPDYYKPYGTIMQGIVATYADGTSERMSWIEIRNVLEKYWYHLKDILREQNGEDLDKYTDERRVYDGLNGETITLKCINIYFQTHQSGCCRFNRVTGQVS